MQAAIIGKMNFSICQLLSLVIVFSGIFPVAVWGGDAFGQDVLRYEGMSFQNLSIQQGLSQVSANTIVQDRKGFIWIGTQDGLNRYDGHEVRVFRHDDGNPNSLVRDFIQALAEDSRGHLWIGTKGKGVDEYDPLTGIFLHHRPVNANAGKSALDIRALAVAGDELLVGTLQGMFFVDLNGGGMVALDPDWGQPTVYALITLSDDSVLIASSLGLHRFDRNNRQIVPAYANVMDSYPGAVVAGYLDSGKRLWLGVEDRGVLVIDTRQRSLIQYFKHDPGAVDSVSAPTVSAFTEDAQHNIWIGSPKGLDVFINTATQLINIADAWRHPSGIQDNSINSLYTDRNGTVWIGTHVGGASHVTPHLVRFARINPAQDLETYNQRILGIDFNADGDMFLGSTEGLIGRRSGNKSFELIPMVDEDSVLARASVYGVLVGSDGTVWAGAKGLRRLPPGQKLLHRVEVESSYFILALVEDRQGFVWLGLPTQLVKYDPVNRKILARLDIPQVYGLLLLDSDQLLVGALGAMQLIDTASGQIISSLDGDRIGFSTVTFLYEDQAGDIWAGTQGDGLMRLRLDVNGRLQDSEVTFFTTKDGLLSNAIGAIQQSADGYLWISTINSISRLNPKTGEIRNFDHKDGASSEGYFIASGNQDQNGLIYFGGTKGLTLFSPQWINTDPSSPGVMLTRLELDNQWMQPGDKNSPLQQQLAYTQELKIPANWSGFSLTFSSDNYTFPESQRFQYRLLGYEEDWRSTDADQRVASYTGLAPGSYRFQVRAANLDGRWSERGTELKVILLPKWYQTVWGWLLMLLAAAAIFYALIRWRLAGLLRRNIELEKRVDTRTRALIEANEKLTYLARTDTLTKLLNRRAFIEHFNALSKSSPTGVESSLALLDIDHFKQFNDSYGHDCGDTVLRELAQVLKGSLRHHDVVARWGGEEFILLLVDTPLEWAQEVVDRLRQAVAGHRCSCNHEDLVVTVTIGLGKCLPNDLDASLKAVDEALFKGKEQGRNCVVVVEQ